jgi:hypothetical protein
MQDVRTRSPGVVIAFPDVSERPQRQQPSVGEPRGEILLFTGVRYERPAPTPGPSHPAVTRRRRRS